jgi:hypothetical protein
MVNTTYLLLLYPLRLLTLVTRRDRTGGRADTARRGRSCLLCGNRVVACARAPNPGETLEDTADWWWRTRILTTFVLYRGGDGCGVCCPIYITSMHRNTTASANTTMSQSWIFWEQEQLNCCTYSVKIKSAIHELTCIHRP